ncbi:MAG: hypothetical protein IJC88_01400 [Oscillospiraceae bacterium]|nr:hypothetical protein [Oscillospiraceae bacterium]
MEQRNIQELLDRLTPGDVLILDAPSGFGKTLSLQKQKRERPDEILVLSYETLAREISGYLKKHRSAKHLTEDFASLLCRCKVLAIEDVDFLAGKTSTLAEICLLVNCISRRKTTAVVMTGIDIYDKMPYFVDYLERASYVKLG